MFQPVKTEPVLLNGLAATVWLPPEATVAEAGAEPLVEPLPLYETVNSCVHLA